LINKDHDFDKAKKHWRLEISLRGKSYPLEILEILSTDTSLLGEKLVEIKDTVISFFSVSDDLALKNKKKSSFFWGQNKPNNYGSK
jgi:hypothetical protein